MSSRQSGAPGARSISLKPGSPELRSGLVDILCGAISSFGAVSFPERNDPMAKRIDPATLPVITGTLYPPPFDEPCRARQRTRLGDVAGPTQFAFHPFPVPPGALPSPRHRHTPAHDNAY